MYAVAVCTFLHFRNMFGIPSRNHLYNLALTSLQKIPTCRFRPRFFSRTIYCFCKPFSGRDNVSKSYRSGLERTGADIGTAPAGGDAIFAPVSEEKSAMQGWNTLVVQPPIGEDGELAEPEAPDAPPARPQLPALPAKAELRDAEVHAMLGELDFGEGAVMGDATAEERQAIANFDIRAFA